MRPLQLLAALGLFTSLPDRLPPPRRPLRPSPLAGRALLQDDVDLVLGLDAAAAAGDLSSLGEGPADATWPATNDPSLAVKLSGAGEAGCTGGCVAEQRSLVWAGWVHWLLCSLRPLTPALLSLLLRLLRGQRRLCGLHRPHRRRRRHLWPVL